MQALAMLVIRDATISSGLIPATMWYSEKPENVATTPAKIDRLFLKKRPVPEK